MFTQIITRGVSRELFSAILLLALSPPTFAQPTTTPRFPTGESGSSRRAQFALKLMF